MECMEGAEAGMEDDLVPRRAQDTPGSLQLGKEISALPPQFINKNGDFQSLRALHGRIPRPGRGLPPGIESMRSEPR